MRADEPEEQKASEWSAGGKLLLVEDEDMVRAVAERALVRAGYTVTTASDGEEGLGIVANGDTQFDLIVSDVVMPAMDGPAMARAIRNVRAHVPILFMSGSKDHIVPPVQMEVMAHSLDTTAWLLCLFASLFFCLFVDVYSRPLAYSFARLHGFTS